MRSIAGLTFLLVPLAVLSSCGPSAETSRTSETKETVYQRGHRLTDDKVGMLLLLKRLHTTYKAADKLERVEQQLKEAGHSE